MEQNFRKQLEILTEAVEKLQKQFEDTQITRDLDFSQQDAIREIVSDRLPDTVWDDIFYVSQIEPWTSGTFTTGTTVGAAVQAGKQETSEGLLLNMSRASRMRSSMYFNNSPVGAVAYIGMTARPADAGSTTLSPDGSLTGFKIVDGRVFGVNFLRGKEAVVDLGFDVTVQKGFILEVRYYPRDRSDFYVNGVKLGSLALYRTDVFNQDVFDLIRVYMYNTAAASHTLVVETYEFLQDRVL